MLHLIIFLLAFLGTQPARAATLAVGPGETYAHVCAAVLAAATNDDVIQIRGEAADGSQIEYVSDESTEVCFWNDINKSRLTFRGVDKDGNAAVGKKRPHLRSVLGTIQNNHGLFDISFTYGATSGGQLPHIVVENVEFSGWLSASGINGQPIWLANGNMTWRNVYSHHNGNGILSFNESSVTGANRIYTYVIEKSEFAYNGSLTMPSTGANPQHHNVYIGELKEFTIRESYVHDPMGGQNLKIRTNIAYVLYNNVCNSASGVWVPPPHNKPTWVQAGYDNYTLDMSIGGDMHVVGNVFCQVNGAQKTIITFSPETAPVGNENEFERLYFVNNTVIDHLPNDPGVIGLRMYFYDARVIKNNIFAGFQASETVLYGTSGPESDPADNIKCTNIADCNFLDAPNFNYHLTASSSAIDAATVDPGVSPRGFDLEPISQYTHERSVGTRTNVGAARDAGAYEYTGPTGTTFTAPILWATTSTSGTTLLWTNAVSDADVTGYRVYRNGVQLATPGDVLTYSDTTGDVGVAYDYKVIADRSGGSSEFSNTVKGVKIRSSSGGTLASGTGWQTLPSSNLNAVCSPTTSCNLIFYNAGLVPDATNNRLYLWGNGGSGGHPGNEVYALDVATLAFVRLNTTDTTLGSGEATTSAPTRPNGRRPWGAQAWVPTQGKFFHQAGNGAMGNSAGTWLWTPGTDTWEQKTPSGTVPSGPYWSAQFNPATGRVLLLSGTRLDEYNFSTNSYTLLKSQTLDGYTNGAVLDPVNNRLYVFGPHFGGYFTLSSPYNYTDITSVSCEYLMATYPALTWNSMTNKIVGWIGGPRVGILDPATNTCTIVDSPGAPGFDMLNYEPMSRFQFMASVGGFFAVDNHTNDVRFLRLSADSGRVSGSLSGGGVMR